MVNGWPSPSTVAATARTGAAKATPVSVPIGTSSTAPQCFAPPIAAMTSR